MLFVERTSWSDMGRQGQGGEMTQTDKRQCYEGRALTDGECRALIQRQARRKDRLADTASKTVTCAYRPGAHRQARDSSAGSSTHPRAPIERRPWSRERSRHG